MHAYSFQKVILCGEIGPYGIKGDSTKGDRPTDLARFSLCTIEKFLPRGGGPASEPKRTYHRVVCWGYLAKYCIKYLRPGSYVLIEGKLVNRSWKDRETGIKMSVTEVQAENMVFLYQAKGKESSDEGQGSDDRDYEETEDREDDDNLF